MEATGLNALHVRLLSLETPASAGSLYRLQATYLDVPVLRCDILSMEAFPLCGRSYCYDQGEYQFEAVAEEICAMVNRPLIVTIEPIAASTTAITIGTTTSGASTKPTLSKTSRAGPLLSESLAFTDISFCNIDLLPVFLGEQKVLIRKRLEPMVQPNVLFRKSWCNLPLVTLEIYVKIYDTSTFSELRRAKSVELTVLAAYNLPYEGVDKITWTIASQLPVWNAQNCATVKFSGHNYNTRTLNDRLDWESDKQDNIGNPLSDKKFTLKLDEIRNADSLDLEKYLNGEQSDAPSAGTAGWYSWQRSVVQHDGDGLAARVRDLKWPVEVRAQGEFNHLHFMAFLDLFPLLYPGEHRVVTAARLWWYQPDEMLQKTGLSSLTPSDPSSGTDNTRPTTRPMSPVVMITDSSAPVMVCNSEDDPAFILIEFTLSSPLLDSCVHPQLTNAKLSEMVLDLERSATRRFCTGRGQADGWRDCVNAGVKLLSRVRTAGSSEGCITSRQLGGSRQLLALHTSLLRHAALYVNESFVLQPQYNDQQYKDLLLTSHSVLLREAAAALDDRQQPGSTVAVSQQSSPAPTVAARCSRQLRDHRHAVQLFLECVALEPLNAAAWRELGTCLLDSEPGQAGVCLRKSFVLDPRNPLTLLSLGSIVRGECPAMAEQFFVALVALHPLWLPGWIASHCYFKDLEQFLVADALLEIAGGLAARAPCEPRFPRDWAHELGDWWEPTPLPDPFSPYLDAADLLLRLRAVQLAEVCLAQHQMVHGESAPYQHLLGLCFFLRGDYSNALCHTQSSLLSHGENRYLLALAGACLLQLGNLPAARSAYSAAVGAGATAAHAVLRAATLQHNRARARIMLQQLLRRHDCAQVWLAFAYNCIVEGDYIQAESCCVSALGKDRRSGVAWAVLARLLARRGRRVRAEFCQSMAEYCGYDAGDTNYLSYITGSTASIEVLVAEKLPQCVCPKDLEDEDITTNDMFDVL